MIDKMLGFPDEVLAVSARGRVTAEDYRETLVPEALNRIERHGTVRLLYHLGPEFDGMTPGAMWADATLGLQHWADFSRVAVVTDVKWIAEAVRLFGPLFRNPVRVFPNDRLDDARLWILEQPAEAQGTRH